MRGIWRQGALGFAGECLERELREDQFWGLQSGAGQFVEWRTGSGGDQEEGLQGKLEAGTETEVREGG